MSELRFVITAQAPLAINERKPGGSQYQEGLDYIPGRVLRGALANLLLRTCTDKLGQENHEHCPKPELCRALLGNQLILRDARPVGHHAQEAHLLPATTFSCKDEGGFLTDQSDSPHGVFDTLIDRAIWEMQGLPVFQYQPRCPVCRGRTKVFSGTYTAQDDEQQQASFRGQHVDRELLTRVAINRRRGVAEDQLLYAVNTLSPHILVKDQDGKRYELARYASSAWWPDALDAETLLAPDVKVLLQQIQQIGSGRSRGLGRVQVQVVDPPVRSPLPQRLAAFNQTFTTHWRFTADLPGTSATSPPNVFAVTLQSDAILTAMADWSPTSTLAPAALWAACGETGLPPSDLALLRSYAQTALRGGWNALWGMRKETTPVVMAGAVYLFGVNDLQGWEPRLEYLETHGIGERHEEGFGQVRICDEFHTRAGGKAV